MMLTVRGRSIRCAAKHGNKQHYLKMYESLSDERLDELALETANDNSTGSNAHVVCRVDGHSNR